jgi:hypothetical protein
MTAIKKALTITLLLAAVTSSCYAQKVANYFHGKPGTATYQGYSFWADKGKPTGITFYSGTNRSDSKVKFNGKATYNGKTCFKMTFPNNKVFYVYPIGLKLAVVNASTKKIETFNWEYEGPVDGRGTFCAACAQDEKEAINLMKASYLK